AQPHGPHPQRASRQGHPRHDHPARRGRHADPRPPPAPARLPRPLDHDAARGRRPRDHAVRDPAPAHGDRGDRDGADGAARRQRAHRRREHGRRAGAAILSVPPAAGRAGGSGRRPASRARLTGEGTAVRRPVRAYAIAIAALAGAVLLRWLLDPLMGRDLPLVTLFGAVAAAVWVGGYRPALVVGILGYAACAYLFIEPRGALRLDALPNVVGLAAYLLTCGLIIGIGEAMHLARRRADEREELLRVTLGSIGDAVIATDIERRRSERDEAGRLL